MQIQDRAKVYTVIGLSIDDVIAIDDYYREEADDHKGKYQQMYEHLSEEQRERLAQYVGDFLWDGDRFEEALQCGLYNLAAVKTDDGRVVKVEVEQ